MAFVSVQSKNLDSKPHFGKVCIHAQVRNKVQLTKLGDGIMLNQRRVGAEGSDFIGLKPGEKRLRPLLLVHVLDCYFGEETEENYKKVFADAAMAYGVVFPGEKGDKEGVYYIVNKTYLKQLDDEQTNDGDDEEIQALINSKG